MRAALCDSIASSTCSVTLGRGVQKIHTTSTGNKYGRHSFSIAKRVHVLIYSLTALRNCRRREKRRQVECSESLTCRE